MPLISYHCDDSISNAYVVHARNYNHRLEYPWTDGLSGLLGYCVQNDLLTTSEIISIKECGAKPNFYMFYDYLTFYFRGFKRQLLEGKVEMFDRLDMLLQLCDDNPFLKAQVLRINFMQDFVLETLSLNLVELGNLDKALISLFEKIMFGLSKFSRFDPGTARLIKSGKYYSVFELDSSEGSRFYFFRNYDSSDQLKVDLFSGDLRCDSFLPINLISRIILFVIPRNSKFRLVDFVFKWALILREKKNRAVSKFRGLAKIPKRIFRVIKNITKKMFYVVNLPLKISYRLLRLVKKCLKKMVTFPV